MESEKSAKKGQKAVEVPPDWAKMTDKEKHDWVKAALTEFAPE